jgi:hypothetical protein
MIKRHLVPATDVALGDQLKTDEGFLQVGGVIRTADDGKLSFLTAAGTVSVLETDQVWVRREDGK